MKLDQQNTSNTSFLDPKMILVIVLCFACLILWQNYLVNKYPDYYNQTQEEQTKPQQEVKAQKLDTKGHLPPIQSESDIQESLVNVKGQYLSFDISNRGFGLKNILINKYKDREDKIVSFNSLLPFSAVKIIGHPDPLIFEVYRQESENKFSGQAQISDHTGEVIIKKTLSVDQEKYFISSEIEITGHLSLIQGIESVFEEEISITESYIPFLPTYDTNSYYVTYSTDSQRDYFLEESSFREFFEQVGLLSIDTHYFARTFIDDSDVFPTAQIIYDGFKKVVSGRISYIFPQGSHQINIKQNLFIGPKQEEVLLTTDRRLRDVMDYGFFDWIAYPIMDLVKILYHLVGNWGVAIILMTLIVKLILLPFNIISYRSMKKLQDLQPQLKALKEKYKDDKVTLNKETMALMQGSGANPLGGCLPILLQFPIFIALFKVLGNAIEFYQAPFYLWIKDLSEPDPYFVLPVLMAISMIVHQKISPATPDPQTRKIMLVITVVFSLFMVIYPSGLALYIFVGSLFSIVQQFFLTKGDKKTSLSLIKTQNAKRRD